jgi:DNA-binding response OmpR family regulator
MVEDEDPIRYLAHEVLTTELEGSTVTAVGTGEAFLAMLDSTKPDLLLLDVRLPDIDGITLYQRARARAELAGVPVLFITASPGAVHGAKLSGRHTCLPKPFDIDVLVNHVHALLASTRVGTGEVARRPARLLHNQG